MKIVFVCQFDPTGGRVGGIGNYVLSFIRFAPKDVSFKIIGVTKTLELFKWHDIELFDKRVQFMPVVKIADSNKKSIIPLAVNFVLGLRKSKCYLDNDEILYCQRNEYVFPFWKTKNKILTIIHNDLSLHLDPMKSENGWSKAPWLYLLIQKWAFARSGHTFSVNHKSIKYVCSHIKNFDSKISFVHTWADPVRFKLKSPSDQELLSDELVKKYNIDSKKKKLIFLGRFQKQKNLPLLLKSFKEVKNEAVLFMAGTGDQQSIIEKFIHENELEKDVILLGNVPHEKVPDVLAACDIYVSSSNFEGMSIALMEALSSGLYTVTTNTGESQHLLNMEKNGIISTDFTPEAFTAALQKGISIISNPGFNFNFDNDKFSPQTSIELVLKQLR